MRINPRSLAIFSGFFLVLSLLVLPAADLRAMLRSDIDLNWLTVNSRDIVVGEVVGMHGQWRTDIPGIEELIVTVVTVRVEDGIKGELLADATTEFAILGGELNGEINRVSDMPELAVGDRGVFFLRDWEGLRVPAAWDFGCALATDQRGARVLLIDTEVEIGELVKQVKALSTDSR